VVTASHVLRQIYQVRERVRVQSQYLSSHTGFQTITHTPQSDMGNFKLKPGTNHADATANLKEPQNTHTTFCPTESETMSAVVLPDWMVDAASSADSDE
jgi:hypothetical protein